MVAGLGVASIVCKLFQGPKAQDNPAPPAPLAIAAPAPRVVVPPVVAMMVTWQLAIVCHGQLFMAMFNKGLDVSPLDVVGFHRVGGPPWVKGRACIPDGNAERWLYVQNVVGLLYPWVVAFADVWWANLNKGLANPFPQEDEGDPNDRRFCPSFDRFDQSC